ncbi:hypothetical protein NC653_007816 [Populus alba x Populus x berolinensis]|uniref:Uncharacterized protein n=1 Tax=Populus alba x Populus x berolinensis TaxID=444605 RepID=A0AAD6R619_9ROSI|nr:hypothetical protein NC653_007816 [Populus alba x Populus x berolinensis]
MACCIDFSSSKLMIACDPPGNGKQRSKCLAELIHIREDGDEAKMLSCLICFSRNKQLNNFPLFSETAFKLMELSLSGTVAGFLPLEPIPNHSFNPHPNQSPLSRGLPSSIGKGSKSTTGPGDCLCDDFFLIEFRLLSFFHRSAFFFFSSFRLASFESVTVCCPRVHPCSTSGCWASPALMAAGSRSRSATQGLPCGDHCWRKMKKSMVMLTSSASVFSAPPFGFSSVLKEMKRSGKMGVDVVVDPCFWRKEIDGDADLLCCLCSLPKKCLGASATAADTVLYFPLPSAATTTSGVSNDDWNSRLSVTDNHSGHPSSLSSSSLSLLLVVLSLLAMA